MLVPEEEKLYVFGLEEYRYAASFFQLEAAFRISFTEDELCGNGRSNRFFNSDK